MIINNRFHKAARYFDYTVLEGYREGNKITLFSATPVWDRSNNSKKIDYCTQEIESGFVDAEPINLDLEGVEEIDGGKLNSLEKVIENLGLVYNQVTQTYTTPEKREESLKKQKEDMLAESKEASFPDLTGSEKQIAWALTLRSNVLKKLETDKANNIKTLTTLKKPVKMEEEAFNKMIEEGLAIVEEKTRALINQAKTETSAKFFIENQKPEIHFNKICNDLILKYNFR